MRLPDADGFIVAAQKALGEHNDIVYLHDAEGAPVVAMLTIDFFRACADGPHFPPLMEYKHDHIEPEMGEEVPWLTST